MKTKEEILAIQQAAVDANGTESLHERLVELFTSLAEYPAPNEGVATEIRALIGNQPDQATEISDEAFPVFVVRDLISKKVVFNPARLAEHWDAFAERYENYLV